MEIRELAVPDSYVLDLVPHGDDRGRFTEWYRADVLAGATGWALPLAQANHSVSARGVLRGVHFALVPPGQAKYVYCPAGRVLDVVIDVRVGSPTFGVHDSVFYCVANMPGAVPHTSTYALTNVTLPYVVALANRGTRAALDADPALARGANVAGGRLVHASVAEAHGLPWVPWQEVLS